MASEPLPGKYPITLYRGDSRTWSLLFTEDDGTTPVDMSGKTWAAQVRSSADATPVLLTLTVDDTDAATGVIVVNLPASQWTDVDIPTTAPTTKWAWDLQSTDGSEVRTWLYGPAKILWDVTR